MKFTYTDNINKVCKVDWDFVCGLSESVLISANSGHSLCAAYLVLSRRRIKYALDVKLLKVITSLVLL